MKYGKTVLTVVALSALLFSATQGFAADVKIGVMDLQKILFDSNAGKAAKVRFEKKMKEFEVKFKTEEDGLKNLQNEIMKKSTAWTEEKKAEKVRDLQKRGRELQEKKEDARYEMKSMQDKELQPILKSLEKIVDTYGEEKGYTVILDRRVGVIYASKAVDVSGDLTKELNKVLKDK
ncbi:OmpH family outer membrane protein [Desulforhopalus singaporensis]|uniref:Periplasmic chaperone for outer membrane proteins Skp n=1 Tax=Desulforhopalus singaporensis TaxID=91360 RepID=A0A1H0THV3_9BACT|nr:OmpH family outer membrane protein [Desulforhopalus singaporensis]SDP53425.1 periplasmic chaperone for outer membrane proteins Skp [Desulforhopalus singaporensis]